MLDMKHTSPFYAFQNIWNIAVFYFLSFLTILIFFFFFFIDFILCTGTVLVWNWVKLHPDATKLKQHYCLKYYCLKYWS